MQALRATDPRRIGPYEVIGRLGAGGMGEVYLARSRAGLRLAVKVVRPEYAQDPVFRARFRQEVRAAQRVGGAGTYTARVVDADPEGEHPWMATEFVTGPSLRRAVAEHGPLPERAVYVLAGALGEALAAIHAQGLVHRDLKPSNILLAPDGPRVIDFGIVRAMEATAVTRTGAIVGSIGYLAPEQIRNGGQVGPPSDVFALGAVLAYAVTGRAPFGEGQDSVILLRILTRDFDLTGVPDGLLPLVGACLDEDPARRPTPRDVIIAAGASLRTTLGPDWYLEGSTGGRGIGVTATAEHLSGVEYLDLADPAPAEAAAGDGKPGDGPPPAASAGGREAPDGQLPGTDGPLPGIAVAEERPADRAREPGAPAPEPARSAPKFASAGAESAPPGPEPAHLERELTDPASPSLPSGDGTGPRSRNPGLVGVVDDPTGEDLEVAPSAHDLTHDQESRPGGLSRRGLLRSLTVGAGVAVAGGAGGWVWLRRSGMMQGSDPEPEVLWRYSGPRPAVTRTAFGSLSSDGEELWVPMEDGTLRVVATDGGEEVWGRAFGDISTLTVSNPVFVGDDAVVLVTDSAEGVDRGLLLALGRNRAERWRRNPPGVRFGNDLLKAGKLVVVAYAVEQVDGPGEVRAYDARGAQVWNTRLTGAQYGELLVVDDVVYVPSFDNHLYALNATDGAVLWKSRLDGDVERPAVNGGTIAVSATDRAATLVGLDEEGTRIWERPGLGNRVFGAGGEDALRFLCVPPEEHTVVGLDTEGRTLWEYEPGGLSFADPVLAGDRWICVAASDALHFLTRDGEVAWKLTVGPGGGTAAPVVRGNRLYAVSAEGVTALALPE